MWTQYSAHNDMTVPTGLYRAIQLNELAIQLNELLILSKLDEYYITDSSWAIHNDAIHWDTLHFSSIAQREILSGSQQTVGMQHWSQPKRGIRGLQMINSRAMCNDNHSRFPSSQEPTETAERNPTQSSAERNAILQSYNTASVLRYYASSDDTNPAFN